MAMISLNLGIVNLLPIPILDGGIIMLLFVESMMRRDISLRIKERIYQTAFVFIVLVFVVVIYNDLMKALPGLAQRLPLDRLIFAEFVGRRWRPICVAAGVAALRLRRISHTTGTLRSQVCVRAHLQTCRKAAHFE